MIITAIFFNIQKITAKYTLFVAIKFSLICIIIPKIRPQMFAIVSMSALMKIS